ncbi:chaperone protein ClpB, partial [candidate division KSB1 bacterium]
KKFKDKAEHLAIKLELTDSAKDKLAELGYDPAFGARPLKRVMEKYIANELSKKVLNGEIKEGDEVDIDFKENRFDFIKKNS